MTILWRRVAITAGPFALLEIALWGKADPLMILIGALTGYFLWFFLYSILVAPYLEHRFGGKW